MECKGWRNSAITLVTSQIGTAIMGSVSEYQKRAAECLERAQIVTAPIDRARWLQLAEQWSVLSRMPLPKATLYRNEPTGLWRDEPRSNSKSLEATHTLPVMKNTPPFVRRSKG